MHYWEPSTSSTHITLYRVRDTLYSSTEMVSRYNIYVIDSVTRWSAGGSGRAVEVECLYKYIGIVSSSEYTWTFYYTCLFINIEGKFMSSPSSADIVNILWFMCTNGFLFVANQKSIVAETSLKRGTSTIITRLMTIYKMYLCIIINSIISTEYLPKPVYDF